jgi:hypothetical protein
MAYVAMLLQGTNEYIVAHMDTGKHIDARCTDKKPAAELMEACHTCAYDSSHGPLPSLPGVLQASSMPATLAHTRHNHFISSRHGHCTASAFGMLLHAAVASPHQP